MRESGAELLGLHTAELYTVLPAEARALQKHENDMQAYAAWSEVRTTETLHAKPEDKGTLRETQNEQWKGPRSVSLSDNMEHLPWLSCVEMEK